MYCMPEMDGIATTRAIRRAVGKDVPIIIISAYDWSDIEQTLLHVVLLSIHNALCYSNKLSLMDSICFFLYI